MTNENAAIAIKSRILKDYGSQIRDGLYGETSKMMAYNSNKIEGSTLTSEQTASLFDTGELYADGGVVYRAKDIEEMNGHFYMFSHALDTLDEPLTEKLIKEFHFCLKNGVFEDRANGYVAGEYKRRANQVSDITTSLPGDVPKQIGRLLSRYQNESVHDLDCLMAFHADFEHVHPFQDGNGRVGRMILFRECLANNLVPVIIRDETKAEYYHALHTAQITGDRYLLVEYAYRMQRVYFRAAQKYIDKEFSR